MASKITKQQRDDLNASHKQLKALIQEGINANHAPAEEAEGELRNYVDQLASKPIAIL